MWKTGYWPKLGRKASLWRLNARRNFEFCWATMLKSRFKRNKKLGWKNERRLQGKGVESPKTWLAFLMVKSHNNTQLFVVVWYLILEFLLDQLRAICKEYQERIQKIESEKYDLEKQVEAKGYEVTEMHVWAKWRSACILLKNWYSTKSKKLRPL